MLRPAINTYDYRSDENDDRHTTDSMYALVHWRAGMHDCNACTASAPPAYLITTTNNLIEVLDQDLNLMYIRQSPLQIIRIFNDFDNQGDWDIVFNNGFCPYMEQQIINFEPRMDFYPIFAMMGYLEIFNGEYDAVNCWETALYHFAHSYHPDWFEFTVEHNSPSGIESLIDSAYDSTSLSN